MLSSENLSVLEYLYTLEGRCIAEDECPAWVDVRRLEYLLDLKYVSRVTLVPPGREGYARGLCGYQLLPAGVDALEEHYHQQEREDELRCEKSYQEELHALERTQDRNDVKKDRYHNFLIAVIQGFLTFAAGVLVEERYQLVQLIYELLGIGH